MLFNIGSNEYDDEYTTAIILSIHIRDPSGNTIPCQYLLQLHDGSTFTKTLTKIDAIANSPINKTCVAPNPYLPVINSLPAWLQHRCKITYNHTGEFHRAS